MFKQRVLTALVLLALVLLLIYCASRSQLMLVALSLIAFSGWEWLQLIPIHRLSNRIVFLAVLLLCVWLSFIFLPIWLLMGLVVWALIFTAVLFYPKSQRMWGYPIVVTATALIELPLVIASLAALYSKDNGKDIILYMLFLVWATDVGAYLAGKQWGSIKLIPQVSPGKTVEGAIGGVFLAMGIAWAASFYFHPTSLVSWFCLAFSTVVMSMLGDLFMSMLKRRSQVKDTGDIFPGHGGLLDRIDSVIAAVPVFYCGLMMT